MLILEYDWALDQIYFLIVFAIFVITNKFQKKKCTLYQKIVRDLSLKAGFELPAEKWRLMSWLENQQFDDVKKDMYTDVEREAALDLYTKQQTIAGDPYLLTEVHKVHRVCNRKY